ncbi:MAG: hypothetical protein ACI87H_002577 [Gammaproteobacteria bacterium]|jgi:hypothetical protein
MKNCLALKVTLLVFLLFDTSSPTFAASNISQPAPTRIVQPEQVKPGDRITVYDKSGRVLELIVEAVITTHQASLDTGLTGTYLSEITSSDGWYFRHKKHRELVITLEQNGNSITGTDRLTNSEISGTLTGNTIKFEFWSGQLNNNNPVVGKWKVNADGTRFEGSWNHGKWDLTRLDPVVEKLNVDFAMIKGRLVEDQSAVEIKLADIEKIEVQKAFLTVDDDAIELTVEAKQLAEEFTGTPFVSTCQISEAARAAIAAAESATPPAPLNFFEGYYEFRDLIRRAKRAAEPPDCNDDKAMELALEAKQLAAQNAEPSLAAEYEEFPSIPKPVMPTFVLGQMSAEILLTLDENIKKAAQITIHEKSGEVLDLTAESLSTEASPDPGTDITGIYVEIGGDLFDLVQSGDKITGTFGDNGGTIRGTRKGDLISFKWERKSEATGIWATGGGELKIDVAESSLIGRWWGSHNDARSGEWELTRLANIDSAKIKGNLMSDQTTVEILLADIDKIEVLKSIPSTKSSAEVDCQASEAARIAIDAAKEKVSGKYRDAQYNLIWQAENATRSPKCDSVKAKILAEKAVELASNSEAVSPPAAPGHKRQVVENFMLRKIDNLKGRCFYESAGWGLVLGATVGSADIGIFTTALGTFLCTTILITDNLFLASTRGSNRERSAAYRETEQYRFFTLTRENLARDMARGGGDYLTTMAYLEGCPVEVHDSFAQMTQRNFKQIIPQAEMDTEAMLHNLEAQMANDPLLAASCSGVS